MKRALLILVAFSFLLHGMESEEQIGLHKRTLTVVDSDQKKVSKSRTYEPTSNQELLAKNKKKEEEWAKISRAAHVYGMIKESKVILSITFCQAVISYLLYMLYTQAKQA